jgi:hypothetical protein
MGSLRVRPEKSVHFASMSDPTKIFFEGGRVRAMAFGAMWIGGREWEGGVGCRVRRKEAAPQSSMASGNSEDGVAAADGILDVEAQRQRVWDEW